jgi:hypothetical protein
VGDLQFEEAEFVGEGGAAPTCAVCGQAIAGPWWMAGAATLCATCKDGVAAWAARRATLVDLGRATLFGLGAAILGAAVWAGIRMATGYELSLVALGIAWLVGRAVVLGGGQGLPQQLLAVALTYLAVVGNYFPVVLGGLEGTDPLSVLLAVVFTLGLPVIFAMEADVLWFIIVGIGLYSAFQYPKRPKIEITGPFEPAAT